MHQVCKFDKMYNGAAAYTNGTYIVFYGGDKSGWQWVASYNAWAGNGPALSAIDDAQGFINSEQFQLASNDVKEFPSFEVTAQVGGNLGDGPARLGIYSLIRCTTELRPTQTGHTLSSTVVIKVAGSG